MAGLHLRGDISEQKYYSYYLLDNTHCRDGHTLDTLTDIKSRETSELDKLILNFNCCGKSLKDAKKRAEEYLDNLFQKTETRDTSLKALHAVKFGATTSPATIEWFETLVQKYFLLATDTTDLEMLGILISRLHKKEHVDRLKTCINAAMPHIPLYILHNCLFCIKHRFGYDMQCKELDEKITALESKFFGFISPTNPEIFGIKKIP
jgi:hypothetical protein